jgi:hypothetical protein
VLRHVAGQAPCDPEVQYLRAALAVACDVCALEIAVKNAALMRMCQRVGDLAGNANGGIAVQAALPANDRRKRFAVDVFHRDPRLAALAANVVDMTDVRVIEAGGGACLVQPPPLDFCCARVEPPRIEELESNAPIEARIAGQIHGAHSTAAERVQDLVRPYVASLAVLDAA